MKPGQGIGFSVPFAVGYKRRILWDIHIKYSRKKFYILVNASTGKQVGLKYRGPAKTLQTHIGIEAIPGELADEFVVHPYFVER